MGAGLLFDGDIELLDNGDGFEALTGADFGSPVPIEVAISSFIRDGAIVAKTGDGNRELSFPVRVRGADLLELAQREARLALACGKPTTIVWTPPDGFGPPSVFEVVTSRLDNPPTDDLAELHNQRTYMLRLTCLPFSRSVGKITDSAAAAPSSGTVQDACEVTTGWSNLSANSPAAPSVDSVIFAEGTGSIKLESGAVSTSTTRVGNTYNTTSYALTKATKVLSVATGAGGGYMSVLLRYDWMGSFAPTLALSMTTSAAAAAVVTPVASEAVAQGFVRYSWLVPASVTVTLLDFTVEQWWNGSNTTRPFFRVDSVTLSASASTSSSISKTFEVKGSARAPGALHVASPSDAVALGQVFVMTVPQADVPDGFQPGVRRWVTSGSTTVDATALGGTYYTVASGGGNYTASATFDVPVSILNPGPYRVVALVKPSAAGTLGVEAQLMVGGVAVGATSVAETELSAGSSVWTMLTIGSVYLPPLPMQNPAATSVVRLRFKTPGAVWAEAFLVPENADYSTVNAGVAAVSATGSSSHVWIDSPSLGSQLGGFWRGTVDTRDNVRAVTMTDLSVPGQHIFVPGTMAAFLVAAGAASGVAGPNLSLEYFPAWHTAAAL